MTDLQRVLDEIHAALPTIGADGELAPLPENRGDDGGGDCPFCEATDDTHQRVRGHMLRADRYLSVLVLSDDNAERLLQLSRNEVNEALALYLKLAGVTP